MTLESVRTFMDYAVIAIAVLNMALAWVNLRSIVALKLARNRYVQAAEGFQKATQDISEVTEQMRRLHPEQDVFGKVYFR